MIIAKQDILYRGKTYKTGDALPEQDVFQVSLWLKAGSAHRVAEKRKEAPMPTTPEAADPVHAPEIEEQPAPAEPEGTAEKPAKKQTKGKAQEVSADEKPAGESQG